VGHSVPVSDVHRIIARTASEAGQLPPSPLAGGGGGGGRGARPTSGGCPHGDGALQRLDLGGRIAVPRQGGRAVLAEPGRGGAGPARCAGQLDRGAQPAIPCVDGPSDARASKRILTGDRQRSCVRPVAAAHDRWPMCGRSAKVKGDSAKLVAVRKRSCVRPLRAATWPRAQIGSANDILTDRRYLYTTGQPDFLVRRFDRSLSFAYVLLLRP